MRQKGRAAPGEFVALRREWHSGDIVQLELPLKMRLETVDPQHTDTVALLRGPLVLMAVKQQQASPLPSLRRAHLLAAKRVSERQGQQALRADR